MWAIGITSWLPGATRAVRSLCWLSTRNATSLHTNARPALRSRAPGSSRASVSTWKPLQMPKTVPPRSAKRLVADMTGEWAAIAPQRR